MLRHNGGHIDILLQLAEYGYLHWATTSKQQDLINDDLKDSFRPIIISLHEAISLLALTSQEVVKAHPASLAQLHKTTALLFEHGLANLGNLDA